MGRDRITESRTARFPQPISEFGVLLFATAFLRSPAFLPRAGLVGAPQTRCSDRHSLAAVVIDPQFRTIRDLWM
jgi:hypothetical protein